MPHILHPSSKASAGASILYNLYSAQIQHRKLLLPVSEDHQAVKHAPPLVGQDGNEGPAVQRQQGLSQPMRLGFPPAMMTATVFTAAFLLTYFPKGQMG